MTRDVHVLPTLDELNDRAAHAVVEVINSTVAAQGRCSLVLSGGTTPRGLYRALAAKPRHAVRWPEVHVFWGDERAVPPDHPDAKQWLLMQTANRVLKEKIEAAFEHNGLTTLNSMLRDELQD